MDNTQNNPAQVSKFNKYSGRTETIPFARAVAILRDNFPRSWRAYEETLSRGVAVYWLMGTMQVAR